MTHQKDDWEKPRGRNQHLTAAEINLLRTSFKAGHSSREAARAIKCSSRVASKYYAQFRLTTDHPKCEPFNPVCDDLRAYEF